MDQLSLNYIWVMEWLSFAREKFKIIANLIRNQGGVDVRHGIDIVRYQERVVLEMFIELSKEGGNYVCWWFDVENVDGKFQIDASLRRRVDIDEESIWQKTETTESVEQLAERFKILLSETSDEIQTKGVLMLDE